MLRISANLKRPDHDDARELAVLRLLDSHGTEQVMVMDTVQATEC
jgi:hypothetical protein